MTVKTLKSHNRNSCRFSLSKRETKFLQSERHSDQINNALDIDYHIVEFLDFIIADAFSSSFRMLNIVLTT